MPQTDIALSRLENQHIAGKRFKTAKDVVKWMGAMQAQDPQMIKWAVGIRLPGTTENIIEEAINRGDLIRTHLLRPTWHLVAAEDLRWILKLTAPNIRTSMRSRNKQLGLTEAIFHKSNHVLQKTLETGKHLSRRELVAELQNAGLPTDDNRSSHLLLHAELEGILCSGGIKDKQMTYALLDERVPAYDVPDRDESLAKLAEIYFTSHCPATVQDFIWWSGLSITDARKATEMIKSGFSAEKIGDTEYLFPIAFSGKTTHMHSIHVLPAFDEFLISYKDRSASLPPKHQHKAVSNNGIFWPVITHRGNVIGTWKRTIKKDKVKIELNYLINPGKEIKVKTEQAFTQYAEFLGKDIEY
ncbi:winged helix DNA-binding domain-containing protein [Sinomicrobium sp. M5D2P17]